MVDKCIQVSKGILFIILMSYLGFATHNPIDGNFSGDDRGVSFGVIAILIIIAWIEIKKLLIKLICR